jgi:hypothetical protein
VLRREAYRTALDAGRPGPQLERAYEQAQARFRRAQRDAAAAQREFAAAQPAAEHANDRVAKERERLQEGGCAACGSDRRVGVLHCGACGAL